MSVAVFRCTSLGARLTVASCAGNHRAANADTSTMRPGQRAAIAARLHALGPCRGCAIGAEHASTGQPHPRVLVEIITSRATPKAAPAPVQLPDFLRPSDAAPAPVPDRITTGDSIMPKTLSPDAARLRELRDALRDAAANRNSRSWPVEAKALACEYRLAGASLVEVEAIGIHRRTLRDWMAEAGHELRRTGRPRGSKSAPKPRVEPATVAPELSPMPAAIRMEPANDTESDGAKHDAGKRRFDLIPHAALDALVDVLGHGAATYGDDNWRRVPRLRSRYYAAAMRHLTRSWQGERVDPDSGLPHLAHAAASIFFLLEVELGGGAR